MATMAPSTPPKLVPVTPVSPKVDLKSLPGLLQLMQSDPKYKVALGQYNQTAEPKLSLLQRIGAGLNSFSTGNALYQSSVNNKPFFQTYGKDIYSGIATAFTGQDKYGDSNKKTYKNLLVDKYKMPDRPGKVDIADLAGLGLDIAADPTTWLGGYVGEAVIGGAKKLVGLGERVPILGTVIRGVKEAFTPELTKSVNALNAAGIESGYYGKELQDLANNFQEATYKLVKGNTVLTNAQLDEYGKMAQIFQKKYGPDGMKQVSMVLQTGKKSGVGAVDDLATHMANIYDNIFTKEAEAGLQAASSKLPNYARRIITPEAKAALDATPDYLYRGVAKPIRQKLGAALQRTTGDIKTIEEVNKYWLDTKGYKLFEDNPFKAQAYRMIEHNKAMAIDGYFKEVKNLASQLPKDLSEKTGLQYVQSTAKQLHGVDLPEPIARFIDKASSTFTHEATTNEFLRFYDKMNSYWKGAVYGYFPSSHTTNIIGGLFNNYLAGAVDPRLYTTSEQILKGAEGAITTKKGAQITFDEIRKAMANLGVIGETGSLDVPEFLRMGIGDSLAQKAAKLPQQVAGKIEARLRTPLFLHSLENGLSPLDAAKNVIKYHFDYTPLGLSEFEKTVMKRIMPFYTFTRNAVPLMIEQTLLQPGKIAAVYKAQHATGMSPSSTEGKYLPAYLRNQFTLKTGPDQLVAGFKIPYEEATQKLESPLRGFMTSVAPWFKIPVELATGKNMYRGIDIANDTNGTQYKDMPKPLQDFLEFTAIKVPANQATGRAAFTKYTVNPFKKYAIENFPFTSRAWNMALRVSQGKDDPKNLLSIITALKTYDVNPQSQQDIYTNKTIKDLQKTLERLGGGYSYTQFLPNKKEAAPIIPLGKMPAPKK